MTATAVSEPLAFDPYDYEFHEDPYPTYARLREEAPLYFSETDQFWALSRHADVLATLRDDDTFSNRMGVSLDASSWNPEAHRVMSFLALDGEDQRRLRRLVSAAFTPRRVKELESQIQGFTDRYVARTLELSGASGATDWIAECAGKVPMDVISELMGVPEVDRDELRRLADLVVHREAGLRDVPPAGIEAAFELVGYYADMVQARRRKPTADLTGALTQAEIEGDRLADHEIIAFLFLMVVAGNETTTKLLGNALYHLSEHPDQQRAVFGDRGGAEMVVPWIEETLRHDTSSQMLARYVTTDVRLLGERVPAGSKLLILLGSANRDERVFSDPGVFNLHRDKEELGQILSFGFGRHFCLGANLARLEARVVLSELVRRVERFEVHKELCERVHSVNVRGFSSLPTSFKRRG